MKNEIFKKVATGAVLLALLSPSALAATVYVGGDGGSLNLRAGAGTGYNIAGYVQHGDDISILSSSGSWSKVEVALTGRTGYIMSKYIRDDATVYISSDGGSLKVRAGTGTNYSVAGYAQHGEKVRVLGADGDWSKIEVKRTGKIGYIRTKYIRSGSSGTGSTGGNPSSSTSAYQPALLMTKTMDGSVHLRSGAGTQFQSLGKLSRGNFLKVTGSDGDWCEVVTTNNKKGYVHKNYVSFGVTAKTTGEVNFRKGAGTNYGKIRTLEKGTSITVSSVNGKWAKVHQGSTTGYISTSYFSF